MYKVQMKLLQIYIRHNNIIALLLLLYLRQNDKKKQVNVEKRI